MKVIQMLGLVILVGIGAGAAIRVILLSQAFGKPNVPLKDAGERDWSFGQLLPLLLLLLPLVSSVEILRGELCFLREIGRSDANEWYVGEMKIPSPMVDNHIPLVDQNDKQGVRTSFQPNPFWGSQVSRFSK